MLVDQSNLRLSYYEIAVKVREVLEDEDLCDELAQHLQLWPSRSLLCRVSHLLKLLRIVSYR